MFKKIGKKWAFLCNPRALFKKKISIILALFLAKNKHCFKHLMLFLRALSVRAYFQIEFVTEMEAPLSHEIYKTKSRAPF